MTTLCREKVNKLVNELNEKFMKSEPFLFVLNNNSSVEIHLKEESKFYSLKYNSKTMQPTEQGIELVNEYVLEKYGVVPTWLHGYCFGLFQNGRYHPTFCKE